MAPSNIDTDARPLLPASIRLHKPDNRSIAQKRLAIWFILITVGLERLAYYSLVGNLVLFLASHSIQWTELHSITASLVFNGTSYVSALIVSWINDSKINRAKTIVAGFVVYISGYLFVLLFSRAEIYEKLCNGQPVSMDESASYFQEKCSPLITSTLIVTGIGIGAVQANMAILGAEQSRGVQSISQYFDLYYIAVNIGSAFAYSIIAYLQQDQSYFLGYLISTILLAVTFAIFLIGYKYKCFIHIKPFQSIVGYLFPVLINALHTWLKHQFHRSTDRSQHRLSNRSNFLGNENELVDNSSSVATQELSSILDYAKASNTGKFHDGPVNDIKALRPIIGMFLILIPYWLLYVQTKTTFIVQGIHMRIPKLTSSTSSMPLIWLSLIDQVIVIVIIIVLNTCVYRRADVNNKFFSIKIRFIIGMVAAAISMIITGIVEIFRQHQCLSSFSQNIGNTTYSAADMSVFYQIPQHISMGIGEAFISVASLEFAYVTAPESARSLVMSLRFCSVGLSSFLGSAYVHVYENIYENFTTANFECKDTKKPELFYIYFFTLACIQLIFILIFIACEWKFKILHAFSNR